MAAKKKNRIPLVEATRLTQRRAQKKGKQSIQHPGSLGTSQTTSLRRIGLAIDGLEIPPKHFKLLRFYICCA